MSVWVVQVQYNYLRDGWEGSRQIPTFNLDPDQVGYDKFRVMEVVKDIVDPYRHASHLGISLELV